MIIGLSLGCLSPPPGRKAPARHACAHRLIRDFPELIRHDPFDRLIVAQASRAGFQLLTADQVLLDLHRDFIIDASR